MTKSAPLGLKKLGKRDWQLVLTAATTVEEGNARKYPIEDGKAVVKLGKDTKRIPVPQLVEVAKAKGLVVTHNNNSMTLAVKQQPIAQQQ